MPPTCSRAAASAPPACVRWPNTPRTAGFDVPLLSRRQVRARGRGRRARQHVHLPGVVRELTAGVPPTGCEFLVMWRKIIVDSDYRAGCPVLAVAVEEPDDDDAPLLAAAAAFGDWTAILADSLREHGADEVIARQTATLVVASIEGTVAICRAERSTTALDDIDAILTHCCAGRLVCLTDHALLTRMRRPEPDRRARPGCPVAGW